MRRALGGFVRFVLLSALLFGAYLAYRYATASPAGGACSDSRDCAPFADVQCLSDPTGRYCTPRCRADADCPAAWRCRTTAALFNAESGERVCVRPTAASPADAGRPAPPARRR